METEGKTADKDLKPEGKQRIEVEGDIITDNKAYPARTPRDVAIHKTRDGEDVELEASKPDRSEPITLPAKVRGAQEFVDKDGQHWTRGELDEQKAPVLDPDAIRKDGGDPGILNIPPNRSGERYAVPGATNESFSPEGVMDRETGAVREKTVEEGGVAPADAMTATLVADAVKGRPAGGAKAKAKAAKAKAAPAAGRGGSSAKAKAKGKPAGGAKKARHK